MKFYTERNMKENDFLSDLKILIKSKITAIPRKPQIE